MYFAQPNKNNKNIGMREYHSGNCEPFAFDYIRRFCYDYMK